MKIKSSILDFPRKTLPTELWLYKDEKELPELKPTLRYLILVEAQKLLKDLSLELTDCMLYGGAASYQWSRGSDVDVSVYAEGWSESITSEEVIEYQTRFKDTEIPYQGYVVHFFLKPPHEKVIEVADAVYDVLNNEWVLPPLVLPEHFDPDTYFLPLIKIAETKAKKFDLGIGKLQRAWQTMEKASLAKEEGARDLDVVLERIEEQKRIIRELVRSLGMGFYKVRENRYAMHDRIRDKMKEDTKIGRFERFQEAEIIWKYLDRAGYNDFLWKLYKLHTTQKIDDILTAY